MSDNSVQDRAMNAFMAYLDTLHDFCGARANSIIDNILVIKYARIGLKDRLKSFRVNDEVSANNIAHVLGFERSDKAIVDQIYALLNYHCYTCKSFEYNVLDFVEKYNFRTSGEVYKQTVEMLKGIDNNYEKSVSSTVANYLPIVDLVVDTSHVKFDTLCESSGTKIRITTASYMDSDGNTVNSGKCGQNDTDMGKTYGLSTDDGDTMGFHSIVVNGSRIDLHADGNNTTSLDALKLAKNTFNVGAYAQFIKNLNTTSGSVAGFKKLIGIPNDIGTDRDLTHSICKIFDMKRAGDWLQIKSIGALKESKNIDAGFVTLDGPAVARAIRYDIPVLRTNLIDTGRKLELTFYGKVDMTPELRAQKRDELHRLSLALNEPYTAPQNPQYDIVLADFSLAYDEFMSKWTILRTDFNDVYIGDVTAASVATKKLTVKGLINTIWTEALSFACFIRTWLSLFETDAAVQQLNRAKLRVYNRLHDMDDAEANLKNGFTEFQNFTNTHQVFTNSMLNMFQGDRVIADIVKTTATLRDLTTNDNGIYEIATNTRDQYESGYVTSEFVNIFARFQSLGDILPRPGARDPKLNTSTLDKYYKYSSVMKQSDDNSKFYSQFVVTHKGSIAVPQLLENIVKDTLKEQNEMKRAVAQKVGSYAVDKELSKLYQKYDLINEKYIHTRGTIPSSTMNAFVRRYTKAKDLFDKSKLVPTVYVYYKDANRVMNKESRANILKVTGRLVETVAAQKSTNEKGQKMKTIMKREQEGQNNNIDASERISYDQNNKTLDKRKKARQQTLHDHDQNNKVLSSPVTGKRSNVQDQSSRQDQDRHRSQLKRPALSPILSAEPPLKQVNRATETHKKTNFSVKTMKQSNTSNSKPLSKNVSQYMDQRQLRRDVRERNVLSKADAKLIAERGNYGFFEPNITQKRQLSPNLSPSLSPDLSSDPSQNNSVYPSKSKRTYFASIRNVMKRFRISGGTLESRGTFPWLCGDDVQRARNVSIYNDALLIPELLGIVSGLCVNVYPKHIADADAAFEDNDPNVALIRSDSHTYEYVDELPMPIFEFDEIDPNYVYVNVMYIPEKGMDPIVDECISNTHNHRYANHVKLNVLKYMINLFMYVTKYREYKEYEPPSRHMSAVHRKDLDEGASPRGPLDKNLDEGASPTNVFDFPSRSARSDHVGGTAGMKTKFMKSAMTRFPAFVRANGLGCQ